MRAAAKLFQGMWLSYSQQPNSLEFRCGACNWFRSVDDEQEEVAEVLDEYLEHKENRHG